MTTAYNPDESHTYSKIDDGDGDSTTVTYKRLTTAKIAHSATNQVGKLSIDAQMSNTVDFNSTYSWSIKHSINGVDIWVPLNTTEGFIANTGANNFAIKSEFTSENLADRNSINLTFQATNTDTVWTSYTGGVAASPILAADIKLVIEWSDKHNVPGDAEYLFGTKMETFRFEFPTIMQSADPSWIFIVTDTVTGQMQEPS